jgi:hypothetical protein
MPVRFSSGIEVTRDQYNHFWGWRFWAERVGLPRGQVSWEAYEEFCVRWFGNVPTMMPLPPLEEEQEEGAGQSVSGQGDVA